MGQLQMEVVGTLIVAERLSAVGQPEGAATMRDRARALFDALQGLAAARSDRMREDYPDARGPCIPPYYLLEKQAHETYQVLFDEHGRPREAVTERPACGDGQGAARP